jgi:peroxiredoxin
MSSSGTTEVGGTAEVAADRTPSAEAAGPPAPPDPGGTPAATPRRPRKIFLLIGLVAAVGLAVGLFTGVGTRPSSTTRPEVGGAAPAFSLPRVGSSGSVGVPSDGGGNGRPAVLLFFGNWCPQCHTELPPLAAEIHRQQRQGGPLSRVSVIGVDDLDRVAEARAFIRSSGVTFPVGLDARADVTNGLYYFPGDPAAVFVDGDGRITSIVYGPLSPAKLDAQAGRLTERRAA